MALRHLACRGFANVLSQPVLHSAGPTAFSFAASSSIASSRALHGFVASSHPATSIWTVIQRVAALPKIYKQLSKFKLSLLVASTAGAGFALGSDAQLDWVKLGWTCFGTLNCAASANALNQVYERANDALMQRTRGRPLPRALITPAHALTFAALTGAAGVTALYYKTTPLAAALGGANIALYACVYTPLKVVSVANTWVGAVVGAVPPLLGWAAASGDISPGAMVLGGMLYFWQLPHFLALAWMSREDYARGGYRMLSLFDASGKRTAACALRNSLYLIPLGLLAAFLGTTSNPVAYENTIASGLLALTATTFYMKPSIATARVLFKASLLHLPLMLTLMVLHRQPNDHTVTWARLGTAVLPLSLQAALGLPVNKKHESEGGDLGMIGDVESLATEPWLTCCAGSGSGHKQRDVALQLLSNVQFVPSPFLPVPMFASTPVALHATAHGPC